MADDNGFAYAKACGIIGKSFLGKRAANLKNIHSLNELDRLVFSLQHKELSDKQLLSDFKSRIDARTVKKILYVIKSYAPEVKLLTLAFKNYKSSELVETGAELDRHYYQELIGSLCELEQGDREIAQKLIADEICIRNCLWALRLRSFYNMTPLQTKNYLLDLKFNSDAFLKKQSLAAKAKSSLQFALDTRQHWEGWKWERFLNPHEDIRSWKADPRYFQNAASLYLCNTVYHNFHSNPLTVSSIYCFIKLMQYEEDLLISAAQAIAFGMEAI